MSMRLSIIILCLLTGASGCSEIGAPPDGSVPDTGEVRETGRRPDGRVYANAFFPLRVGNEWRFVVTNREDVWMVKRVVDSSWAGSRLLYHVPERWANGDVHPRLYSVDSNGVVYEHEGRADSVGTIYLRTDAEPGVEWATLTSVRERYAQEAVPAGTFGPCVSVQRWAGESQYETYAENIGEIRRASFGGRSLRLTSAAVGGVSYP